MELGERRECTLLIIFSGFSKGKVGSPPPPFLHSFFLPNQSANLVLQTIYQNLRFCFHWLAASEGCGALLSVSCEFVLNLALAPSRVEMGHLLKLKCANSPLNQRTLSSTRFPFTLTTVQVPNLALTHTKRFTVWRVSAESH
jgi:hypothetical protein